MGNKVKEGLLFFPMDTDFFTDRKVRKLVKKHGSKGLLIYLFLLCHIYRDKGYYIKWDEDYAFDISYDNQIELDQVYAVVEDCITLKLFDANMFKQFNILTSSGIQKRYKEVTKRRANTINPAYSIDTDLDTTAPAPVIKPGLITMVAPDVVKSIMEFFGFDEMVNFNKARDTAKFVNLLVHNKQIDQFKAQFDAYKKYKKLTAEKIHSFHNFLDHGWDDNNWVFMLKQLDDGQSEADPNEEAKRIVREQKHAAGNRG